MHTKLYHEGGNMKNMESVSVFDLDQISKDIRIISELIYDHAVAASTAGDPSGFTEEDTACFFSRLLEERADRIDRISDLLSGK